MENLLSLKVYAQDTAQKLIQQLKKISLKEITGEGTFEVIATTDTVDRHGEVILATAWDFTNYMKNPIMLWGHDYWSIDSIIGAVTEIMPEEGKIIIRGTFASTEAGQKVRKLYDDGILRAVSVGFIPLEREGNTITKAELLEVSFVSVPANPDAITTEKMLELEEIKTLTTKQPDQDTQEATTTEVSQAHEEETAIAEEVEKLKKLHADLGSIIAYHSPKRLEETKSGRVLSSKNYELVKTAIDALTALLEASESEKAILAEKKEVVFDAQAMQKMLERVIQGVKKL